MGRTIGPRYFGGLGHAFGERRDLLGDDLGLGPYDTVARNDVCPLKRRGEE